MQIAKVYTQSYAVLAAFKFPNMSSADFNKINW